jgi:hypothetical protein
MNSSTHSLHRTLQPLLQNWVRQPETMLLESNAYEGSDSSHHYISILALRQGKLLQKGVKS